MAPHNTIVNSGPCISFSSPCISFPGWLVDNFLRRILRITPATLTDKTGLSNYRAEGFSVHCRNRHCRNRLVCPCLLFSTARPHAHENCQIKKKKKKILVVEDSSGIRRSFPKPSKTESTAHRFSTDKKKMNK